MVGGDNYYKFAFASIYKNIFLEILLSCSRSFRTWAVRRNFTAEFFIDSRCELFIHSPKTSPSNWAIYEDGLCGMCPRKLVSIFGEILNEIRVETVACRHFLFPKRLAGIDFLPCRLLQRHSLSFHQTPVECCHYGQTLRLLHEPIHTLSWYVVAACCDPRAHV